MVTRCGLIGAIGGLALWSGVAHAQAPANRVQLRYDAPAECPDDVEMVGIVQDLLGRPIGEASQQPLLIELRIVGEASTGYSAKLIFGRKDGRTERFLEHPQCGKLAEAAGLVAALAIDPDGVKARQQRDSTGDAESATPSPTPKPIHEERAHSSVPPAIQPTRPRASEPLCTAPTNDAGPHTSVALMGHVVSGVLPSVVPGLEVELAWRWGALETGLGARYWASRTVAVPRVSRSFLDVSLVSLGARLCAAATLDSWALPICARVEVGDLQGAGQYVDNARTRHGVLTELGASVAASYTRLRVAPIFGMEAGWAASRPRFGVVHNGVEVEVFRPDGWALGGFLGLAYRL